MDVPRKIAHPELEPEHKEPSRTGPIVLEQVQKSFRWRTNLIVGGVLLFIVVVFAGSKVYQELTRHRTIPSGPPAPWPTQLAVAQKALPHGGEGSVLEHVFARQPIGGPYTVSTTMQIDFVLITPDGNAVLAKIEDSQPAALVEARESGPRSTYKLSFEQLRAATEAIKISPREAAIATIPELEAGIGRDPQTGMGTIGLLVMLAFREEVDRARWPTDSPVAWSVSYIGWGAHFLVDAETGQVVLREFDIFDRNTATPTPYDR